VRRNAHALGLGTCLLLAALCLLASAPAARADAVSAQETAVKAAYVYNFAKFTEWPAGALSAAGGELRLCLVGNDELADALEGIAGKPIGNRRLSVVRAASVGALEGCQMVYVATSEAPRVATLVARLAGRPVLSVGDLSGFAAAGGMIGLVRAGDRVRFEINRGAAERAGLRISSKLLGLAAVVHGGGAP
jgi:hypothetical protein